MKYLVLICTLLLVGCNQKIIIDTEQKTDSRFYTSENDTLAGIVFNYPVIKNEGEIFASINKEVNNILIGKRENNQYNTIQKVQDGFIKEFSDFKKEFPESHQKWSVKQTMDIFYNNNNILGISIDIYTYLGGAHPNTSETFFYYDLETGKKLKITDFFEKSKLRKLFRLAENKFRKMNGFDEKTLYIDQGYFFDNGQLRLTDNFRLTKEGCKFVFNPYEIAIYAKGKTIIKFEKSEINKFLKKEFRFK